MERCPNSSEFERHARGEMDLAAAQCFEQHLGACEHCRATYAPFQRDHEFVAGLKKVLDSSGLEPTATEAPRPPGEIAPTLTESSLPGPVWPEMAGRPRERFPEIPGYLIKRVLGRGGMGIVYEAIQEKLGRPVALKLLPAVVSTVHPELITRFKREAAAAARLHHTHIIPIYDFGESREGYYYAMELIAGQPFNVVIKRLAHRDVHLASPGALAALLTDTGPPCADGPPEGAAASEPPSGTSGSSTSTRSRLYYRQVARWMADAAEALHYAHLQGMVHRDIKPGNLMLSTDGRIVLLDFGLVKTADERSVTATGSLVGSYRYMSPEQVGAKRITVDARSDVYSLGATLYELLTFQPAFPSTEQSELLSQILFKEPTPPRKIVPSVPLDLQTICLKALEKSPNARYPSAKAMVDDLNAYLHDQTIVARRPGPLRRLAKLIRRRRVEATAIIAVLLVAGVGMTLVVRSRQRERVEVRLRLMKQGIEQWKQDEDWKAAERSFRQVLKMNADDYAALVNLACVYKDQYWADRDADLLAQGERLLERALVVDPQRKDAWNARGDLYMAWDRPADAITAFQQVRRLDESYFPAWVNLAMAYALCGDFAEGERCALKGVELSRTEGTPMPLRILAAIQLHLGRSEFPGTLDRARTKCKKPDDVTPLIIMEARHYLAQEGEEHARAALDLAVSADTLAETTPPPGERPPPGSEMLPRAKRTLALARLRNRQWQAAADAAQQALAAGDEPTCARLVLAIATARLGKTNAAAEYLHQAQADWPGPLRTAGVRVTQNGFSLWFDTAEEWRRLEEEARRLIGEDK